MYLYPNDLYRKFDTNLLVANYNVCAPNWGEVNCKYDYYKFYYFQDGDCTLQVNQDIFHPQKGELYLIPSRVQHTYSHNPENPVCKYWCHFSIDPFDLWQITYVKECFCCRPDPDIIKPLFEQLVTTYHEPSPLSILVQKSVLTRICYEFFQLIDINRFLRKQDDSFHNTITTYISNHLSDKLTLQELADLTHTQKNYFISKFKKTFGVTPIEYINSLRLEAFLKDLSTYPDISITQLSLNYGFDDYRYFNRLFKQRYGITPSAYRHSLVK